MIQLLVRSLVMAFGAWLLFLGYDMYTGLYNPGAWDALATMGIQLMGLASIIWSITSGADDAWEDAEYTDDPLPTISWQDTQPVER